MQILKVLNKFCSTMSKMIKILNMFENFVYNYRVFIKIALLTERLTEMVPNKRPKTWFCLMLSNED